MGRRRGRSRKRRNRGGGTEGVGATAAPTAAAGASSPGGVPGGVPGGGVPEPPAAKGLRPWRTRMADLLDHLRSWSRESYAEAVEAFLAQHLSAQGYPGPSDAEADAEANADAIRPEDVDRAIEDFACAVGSAGGDRSILSVFAEQAPGVDGGDMDPEDRSQLLRWERERRRGVFLIQHATRDRLTLWDPLEGAPLTLHLLLKLSEARVGLLRRGTVVTATYQPWMARLVAVGEVEYFADGRAVALFREETVSSGAQWHEAPPPAPKPTTRKLK